MNDFNLSNCGVGHIDEWHLVLPNPFPHIAFGLASWFSEKAVVFGSAFSQPRFIPVGAIRDPVAGDRVEQVLVEDLAEGRVVFALESDHRLEGFERLNRSLEADRSRFDAVFGCGLCDDRADEVVGQDMRPEFLPDQFRRLAPQDVHLQRFFQRPQIELGVPARPIKMCEIVLGEFIRVQQRRGDDEGLDTKARLLDLDATFSDHQELGERVVGLPVDRTGLRSVWAI